MDNYGLLNLDIAWSYLLLGNVKDLPDAHRRLSECSSSFHKSYGADLQRLTMIKGGTGNIVSIYNAHICLILFLR